MRSSAETHRLLSDQMMVIRSMHGVEATQRNDRLRCLGSDLRSCHQSRRSIGSYWLQISKRWITMLDKSIKMSDRNLRLRKASLVERALCWRISKLSCQPKLIYLIKQGSLKTKITAPKSFRTKFKSWKARYSYRTTKRLRKLQTLCWKRPIKSMR